MKTDPTVIKETIYIAAWTLILSGIMQAVFLIIGKWDYTVLLGNLLAAAVSILNFFLLGRTVQKAITKDPDEAKNFMKVSQGGRFLLIIAAAALGASLSCFNIWAVLIPLLFPRIAIALRPLFMKNEPEKGSDSIG